MPNLNYIDRAVTIADRAVDRAILALLIDDKKTALKFTECADLAIMAAKKTLPNYDKKTALIHNRQIARIGAEISRIRSILTI